MADVTAHIRWTGEGLQFVAGVDGKPHIVLDGDGVTGVAPAATLILALGACTAADVVDITGKMRVGLGALDVAIEGDRAPEPPRRYTRILLRYRATGVAPEERDKIRRALDLSHEKYCSVLHSLREDVEIGTELEFV
jgi:putative redox protein